MPYSIDTVHPLLVHFPIALFSTGLFFDILAKLLDNEEFDHAGFWTMLMALISSPFTIIAGIFAFMEEGSWLDLYQFQHGLLAFISTLFLLVLFWARIKFQLDFRYSGLKRNIYLVLHILAVGILFYGAHLGAKTADRI
ncbi:uncharacterized protein METZ01_LOCUS452791 [marine metagenome]|uniref:DUF2231 domain-containing protein n=1 Tax=marine metagenome TaxID=408172 RepID=A0A382ZWP9_9ZZZZ